MVSETTPLVEENHPLQVEDLPPPKNLGYILLSLWTSSFLSAADTTVVATTANAIASAMDGSDQITWIAASYLLTNAIFQPLVGKISDVFGRRSTLICTQVWFVIGCLCCSLSNSVFAFSVSRAVAGIGGGGMSALSSIVVTDVVPLHHRGIYQGYANMIYAGGCFVGPVVGSLFLTVDEKSGWRWMFAIQVPLVMFTSYLACCHVHEYRFDAEERKKQRKFSSLKQIDLPGSLTLALVITSVVALFQAKSKLSAEICFVASLVSATAFYLVEKYIATSHVIPPSAFQGILRVSSLIAFFGTMTIFSMNFLVPLYLQVIHDFSSFQLGVFNSFGIVLSSGGSLLGGWLLKTKTSLPAHETVRRAVKVSIFGCSCIFTGSFLSMLIINNFRPTVSREDINFPKLTLLVVTRAFAALGSGCFSVALLILVVAKVGIRKQASVTGMNYMFRSMGSVSGVGTSLGLYNLLLGNKLVAYFKDKENGSLILDRLQKSSFYIREGMPAAYVNKVLGIYRSSFGNAMMMVATMGCSALLLSLLMKVYQRVEKESMV